VHELLRSAPGVDVLWRAFALRPESVATLDPGGEYLRAVWRNSVYPMADRRGMTMKLPPVQPRSRLAHSAAHWAREQRRFTTTTRWSFAPSLRDGKISRLEALASLALLLTFAFGFPRFGA
jgi:predicted DsbA family dithiol-disulfide isomerase